ncbi:trigger factor [Thermosyntropha lipolytica DSM 11003]|uniref:Trigger factor n=1 Tax=Thermosyntropha lipolytica DSM 11003 TaxID=1123382 RepID=A0A1M5ML04_9FIRM|nr:trigger factor [Thermosyntropha lipolytica]SHG77988.1 trigger factor [Thermosyntropha lipolytica DSM 11003]
MEARLEKIENSEACIQIEVDADKLEEGLQYAYRKIVKKVSIPGFRKGKAPRPLLEAYYGKEILYQDALEYIVPEAYEKALEELNIEPIAEPDFEIGEIEAGKPFTFKAVVPVKPEVKLGNIEGLEIEVPELVVTEKEVERSLENLRASYAELVTKVDEPAASGDTVVIDFEGFIGDEPFKGGKGEGYPLELGSNTFIPGFEEQLIGAKAGDTVEVNVIFPEDYHAEDLAGKEARFVVKVNKVETKKLKELNDEFAQEISEFNTLDELKDDIRKRLEETVERQKKEILKNEIVEKLLEVCEIAVPRAVVEDQARRMMQEFERNLYAQGLNLQAYFNAMNMTEDEFIQDIWPEAEKRVKTNFILEKIIEEKGFTVTDEEIDKEIGEMAENMGMDLEKAKEVFAGMRERMAYALKVDKAFDYLISKANIEVKKAEEKEEKSE